MVTRKSKAVVKEAEDIRPKAKHYYELHITVEEKQMLQGWDRFKQFVAVTLPSWRVSKFSEDDVDDYHGKWFLSARIEYDDQILPTLQDAVSALVLKRYVVLRWKAEDTLFDSKYGDVL